MAGPGLHGRDRRGVGPWGVCEEVDVTPPLPNFTSQNPRDPRPGGPDYSLSPHLLIRGIPRRPLNVTKNFPVITAEWTDSVSNITPQREYRIEHTT